MMTKGSSWPIALGLTLLVASLVLFALSSPLIVHEAGASEELLGTCTAKTQSGVVGSFMSATASCSIPGDVRITRAVLDYMLDDGGEVYVNGNEIFSLPNDWGVDSGRIGVNPGLSAGQNFMLKVEARNALDDSGEPVGPVYGRATLEIYGERAPAPTHTECRNNACVVVSGTGSNQCTSDSQCAPAPTHTECRNNACVVVSGTGSNQCTTNAQCAPQNAQLTIQKEFTNGSGTASDFVFTVGGQEFRHGQTITLAPGSYTITETPRSGFELVGFGGACGSNGSITLAPGQSATCIATNRVITAPVSCVASPSSGTVNQNIGFTASGGNGTYSWFAGGGNPSSGSGQTFSSQFDFAGLKTITVTSGGQSGTCSVNIQNIAPPTADIKANGQDGPITVSTSQSVSLSWSSTNASHCTISPGGWTGLSGVQQSPQLTGTQTYTVSCTGPGGSAQDSVTINVQANAVSCAASTNTPGVNQSVLFTASGGNGTYSWFAGGGNPSSGSGQTFSSQFDFAGLKTITVTSGGQSASCNVNVQAPPSLSCASSNANPNLNQSVLFTASGGNGTYSWFAGGGNPSSGSGQTFSSQFDFAGLKTITVTSGGQSASCNVNVQAPPSLSCAPNISNPGLNQAVIFAATGGTGTYNWFAGTGNPSSGSGQSFVSQFSSGGSQYVTVTSGGQSASCSVNVQVVQNLTCSASPQVANVNQSVFFTASGGSGTYNWTVGGGNPTVGSGSSFTSSFNNSGNYYATVTSGGQTATCSVFIQQTNNQQPQVNLVANPSTINQGQQSTLSWYSTNATNCYVSGGWSGNRVLTGQEQVAPSITTAYTITCTNPYGVASDTETVFVQNQNTANNLQLTKTVLNRTTNQTGFTNSVDAQGLDVLEFEIRVRNIDTQSGAVNVRDVLPSQLFYIPGSTTVNGGSVGDGISGGGLSVGTLFPNEEKAIRFRAVVFAGTSPQFLTNQVTATMNAGVQNAYAGIQIRNRGQVLGAADIVTGPEDMLPAVLLIGFAGSLLSYFAFFRFGLADALNAAPASDFDQLVAKLRAEEERPDTEGLPPLA